MITFDEIVDKKEYRERIVKFFQLPIRLSVSKEKFMSDLEFMKETNYDEYSKVVEYVVADFNKIAKEQKTRTPDFSMEDILEPLVENIEAMDAWVSFLKEDNSEVLSSYKGITNTHGFYKKENDGKFFLSVDLETANWQSLQKILGFKESYKETIVNYTDNLIPPVSKSFRAKVTSLLSAKNIMMYNKKLLVENKKGIIELANKHLDVKIPNEEPFAIYADEFLIEIDEQTFEGLQKADLENMKKAIEDKMDIKVHIRPFELRWLNVNKACVKIHKDSYEIINLSKDVSLLMRKIIHNVKIEEVDFERINLKEETKEEYVSRLKKAIEDKIELEGLS